MRIEHVIFANLLENENYSRKVIPFLKEEYFTDTVEHKIFSIINDLKLPIQFVGLGEGLRNMVPFDPDLYVASLFEDTEA